MKTDFFPVLWPLLSFFFFNLLAYGVQHFHSITFWIWNSSTGIPLPLLALFIMMLPKAYLTSHSRMFGSRWVIKQNLVLTNRSVCEHKDPGERCSDHKRDWPRLAYECPEVSGRCMGQRWPAAESGALSAAVCAGDLLKEVSITVITSTTVWLQVNNRQGTQPHPSTESWIKDLLSMAPPYWTRSHLPLSFSHQEASISLLFFSIIGKTDWKPQSQKTNQSDHMDHSLV